MRVFFYFKYNSTDFLIFRLTVLEKRGAILHRNRKVLNSCFLKVQNLFFLEFYSIYPFPLTFLSVDFIVAALNSWRSMKCPPTHMGCQTVFMRIPCWRVISHYRRVVRFFLSTCVPESTNNVDTCSFSSVSPPHSWTAAFAVWYATTNCCYLYSLKEVCK